MSNHQFLNIAIHGHSIRPIASNNDTFKEFHEQIRFFLPSTNPKNLYL